ncbi:hypothetical protein E3N88_00405 [Mikania micrantha]|uniref:Uncharacterized protein n=1 Tax=Mikania micrantha TaxID=192012 RepID=A0A5N6PY18_9ASTR|nr:hypothetical protein E3N88_00405 [Mikania micrantha]
MTLAFVQLMSLGLGYGIYLEGLSTLELPYQQYSEGLRRKEFNTAFGEKTRAPRPLLARLHFPASKLKRSKGKFDDEYLD